jgi:LacI family xylobiose transport system transcriptional regulator
MEPTRRPTLATIASAAAVSITTVSKVLNGRPGVSDETRVIVEQLLDKHGYQPRGLANASSPMIELVFSELDTAWALELIRGVERVARANKMSLILTESGDRHFPAPDWIDGVLRRRPFGIILILSDLPVAHKRQLQTRRIPFVVVDPSGNPAPDVPSIGTTNWDGGVLATKHLVDLGHRRIGVIGGPTDVMSFRARMSGFRFVMREADIPIDDELIVPGNYDVDSGVAGGRTLLSSANPPTAIFAMNDLQAFGVYEAARSLGVSIPGDLSVVGFDDVQMARWAGPPLTTVRQPLTAMAEEAARLVIRLHNGQEHQIRHDLATELITRGSTREVRSKAPANHGHQTLPAK